MQSAPFALFSRSQTDRRATILLVACMAIIVSSRCALAAENAKPPNMVLVMADDQGWGDTAYNGHPLLITPNLDQMAAETYRFDRFYAAHPNCSPTRASILTGRHPNRSGVFTPGLPIQPQEYTLAQALRQAGYATGHFGKWHVGSVFAESPVNPTALGFDEWLSAPNYYDNDPIMSRQGKAEPHQGESSMVAADAALAFMKKQTDLGKPFLALVWFGSPHVPHIASDALAALYPDVRGKDKGGNRDWLAEISGIDAAVGKLRREIRELGIRDDTILWYLSDNGGLEEASSGGRGKKGSIYEGGLRVPALLESPARFPGHRVLTMPCNTSDLFPTLLEIAGVQVQDKRPRDGISLLPLLEGQMNQRPQGIGFWEYAARGHRQSSAKIMADLLADQQARRTTLRPELQELAFPDAAEIPSYPADTFAGKRGGHAAWLDWPWKLHRIQAKDASDSTFELYNLAEDPNEQKNLLAQHPERAAAMKASLESWRQSVVHSLNGKDY